MTWRKSTYSGGANGNCVEVGSASGILVRDTTSRGSGFIKFSSMAWDEFIATLK